MVEKRLDPSQQPQVTADLLSQIAAIVNGKLLQKSGGIIIGAASNGIFSGIVSASKVDGDFTLANSVGAWVDFPGPGGAGTYDLTFTPTATGKAEISVSGTVETSGWDIGFGFKVNGVDLLASGLSSGYPPGFVVAGGGRGGVTNSLIIHPVCFTVLIDVTAGIPVTVRLRASILNEGQGAPTSLNIYSSPSHPFNMSVKFP